jgi:hypothetical protein
MEILSKLWWLIIEYNWFGISFAFITFEKTLYVLDPFQILLPFVVIKPLEYISNIIDRFEYSLLKKSDVHKKIIFLHFKMCHRCVNIPFTLKFTHLHYTWYV